MSDEASLEQGQADSQDQQDQQDEQESTQHDWEKDYKELQATYTREKQKLTDEQAILAHIQEKFPHLIAAEDEEPEEEPDDTYDDDDDPRFAELAELKKESATTREFIASQLAKEDRAMFDRDLAEEAGDRELTAQAKKAIWAETLELGGGKENLKKALTAWVEYEDGLGEQYLERVKKSKRTHHTSANGTAATGTKPLEDMTREEHTAWMVEQALARDSQ